MKTILHDAHVGLLRSLRLLLTTGGVASGLPPLTIEGLSARPWASATFSGHTHSIELRLRGGSVEPLLAQLTTVDPMIPGHALIDLTIAEVARDHDGVRVVIEALTLED